MAITTLKADSHQSSGTGWRGAFASGGDPVKGGIYGQPPSLGDLDPTGNLKYTVDFRSVYQEILGAHLGADPREILGGSFEKLGFVRAPVRAF